MRRRCVLWLYYPEHPVSSDILIGVAKEFKVSTDYILGLSNISVRKSYDISELDLSESAVKGLAAGAVDMEILNRLMEHKIFPRLIGLMRIYFQDTVAMGIMTRNQIIEMATTSFSDLIKERPGLLDRSSNLCRWTRKLPTYSGS